MPYLVIRTVDSTSEAEDDGAEYESVDAAYAAAVNSGVALAADEIWKGNEAAIVEVCVEDADGNPVARGAVALSVARLANR